MFRLMSRENGTSREKVFSSSKGSGKLLFQSISISAIGPKASTVGKLTWSHWHYIWNLGTHDFMYDFTIFFMYMNSYMTL